MDFESKDILLSQIDWADQTYRISTDDTTETLKASIQSIGLLHPPILLPRTSPTSANNLYTPVTGFRRIKVCRELGWTRLTANCLKTDTPFYNSVLVAISENYFQRELNLVEMARCFALVEKTGEKRKAAYQLLNSIGLQTNDAMVAKLKKVDSMDDQLKRGLIEGSIALPVALELYDVSNEPGGRALIEFLLALRISLSRQREMKDWIQAIALRERSDIKAVLEDEAIQHYLIDTTLDTPRKANLIRGYLRRRRYPEITNYELKYADTVKFLPLQESLRLIPPANFESPSYSLNIDFTTVEELFQGAEKAIELSKSPSLKSLLKSPKV